MQEIILYAAKSSKIKWINIHKMTFKIYNYCEGGDSVARRNWTREETILAMDLYTRVPFSKIGKNNQEIIRLAQIIDRTPDAVAYKMSNLAHYDPELQARNVSGLSHTSKLDKVIYDEFANNIEELSFISQKILADMQHTSIETLLPNLDLEHIPLGKDREQQTKIRIGQYFFRMSVLMSYGNACCITGLKNKEMLVASNIKPWSVSNARTERTNPSNGLCLNAMHDKAFDRGLITIDKNYRVVNSKLIKETAMDEKTKEWFSFYNGKEIILPDKFLPGKDFIEYHNDVIFKGA